MITIRFTNAHKFYNDLFGLFTKRHILDYPRPVEVKGISKGIWVATFKPEQLAILTPEEISSLNQY